LINYPDTCLEWFHGSCVGISPKKGKEMEDNGQEWTCPKCREFSKGVASKSMKPHPQLPRIDQARLSAFPPLPPTISRKKSNKEAQEEPEVLKLRYFRCPMCNNPYREKSEVELHIIGTHNMTIDMLKTMVTCGAIKIIEETFQ
jgi:rubredoxin